jgi:hypothetical protein
MSPHNRHANTTGTDAPEGEDVRGVSAQCPRLEFGRADVSQNSVLPAPKIDVRQGITRRRGHVAPARLLC